MAMTHSAITELGYIGFGVSDAEAWRAFASDVLALEVNDDGDKLRLRYDYWHNRVILHPGQGNDDLLYAGFRVAGPEELRAMQHHLSSLDVPFEVASDEEADERHVLEYIRLKDPSGIPLEIFHGPHVDNHLPFRPGRGMHGRFKTGDGGLGHIVVGGTDEKIYRFYTDVLGFRGSIEVRRNGGGKKLEAYFMHCNERDHSIAFGLKVDKLIQHLMIEVDNPDDVGLAYDIAQRKNVPIKVSLGKHANDGMFSFYMISPSGWLLEYGCTEQTSKYQSEYHTGEIWGHVHNPAIGSAILPAGG